MNTQYSKSPLQWRVSDTLVSYPEALAEMDARVAQMETGESGEMVWLLEHPPLYTAGTSANIADLKDPDRFPVYDAGRGGQYTYHGPGQRVGYFMLDLRQRGKDVRRFIYNLEEVMIKALAAFSVTAERRQGRVGVWVDRGNGREDKIAAIGVRVRKWITFHGIAINVHPNLSHFEGIVPCGISEHGVTSLHDLGVKATLSDMDEALYKAFIDIFDLEPTGMAAMPTSAPEPTSAPAARPAPSIETSHPVFRLD